MRTLAIDLGNKRVGLALSDESARFVSPYDVLEVADASHAMAPVLKLIQREGIARVVIGLPLNMDDSVGPAAKAVVAWGRKLAAGSGLEPVFVDERLSSFAAEQSLSERRRAGEKLTRGRKKQQLDAVAAAGFLQEFLDGKLQPIDLTSLKLGK